LTRVFCVKIAAMRTISLTAHRRPEYLGRVLQALSRCAGIERYHVRIFCDPTKRKREQRACVEQACVEQADRYGFDCVVNERQLGVDGNTGKAVRWGFEAGSSYHVHMEDDTLPSRGTLLWFEWAEHLGSNADFFSVSGYERMPSGSVFEYGARPWFHPWGFATWADRWEQVAWRGALLPGTGWDTRLNKLRGERLEAFPRVSRMQNIGESKGVHVRSSAWHREHHHAFATTDDLVSAFEFRATP